MLVTILREKPLQEMANLLKRYTGLPYDIWLDSLGCKRDVPHNLPRLKVVVDGNRIPVSIDESKPVILVNAKISKFKEISNWITAKYPILIRHWNKEIDDEEAIALLKK